VNAHRLLCDALDLAAVRVERAGPLLLPGTRGEASVVVDLSPRRLSGTPLETALRVCTDTVEEFEISTKAVMCVHPCDGSDVDVDSEKAHTRAADAVASASRGPVPVWALPSVGLRVEVRTLAAAKDLARRLAACPHDSYG
jgi:hypothetical protein